MEDHNTPMTQGIHHLGLSVTRLAKSADFFERVLQFKRVAERPDYPAIFVSDGQIMLTLWQVEDPANAATFDRRHAVGLHHFALRVKDAKTLGNLYRRLIEEPDVAIEFAPEPLKGGPTEHMMCVVAGSFRLELIALAG